MPLLNKWCDLNKNFYEKLGDDCPWWNNERASIGILAAAAWKAKGFLALEEFCIKKGRRRTGERAGRCDLKIWNASKEEFAFEAKQTWCKLQSGIDLNRKYNNIKAAFHDAQENARKLKPSMGRRFGLCFVSPRILVNEKDCLDARLDDLLDLLSYKMRHDAIAWFFVDNPEVLEDNSTGLLYPGIILLLKEVKK